MRKRIRDRRNSSSMASLYTESVEMQECTEKTPLKPVRRIRAMSKVYQYLAHLGFEQQGICNASECFLRDLDVGFLKGIAS
jgi:hypothetical protein